MAQFLLVIPLITSFLGFIINARKILCFSMFVTAGIAVFLFLSFNGIPFIITISKFLPNVNYALRFDNISLTFTMMISIISALGSLYTLGYIASQDYQNKILRINAIFTASLIYFICSDNLFSLCIGYGMASILAFFIISVYDMKASVNNLAAKVTSANFIGYVILLIVTALLYNKTNSFNFSAILKELSNQNYKTILYPISFCIFIMSATLGFHNWLIKAHKSSQTSMIFLYSSSFISCGIFLMGRFYPIFINNQKLTGLFIGYCAISSVVLSFYACSQSDLKKIALISSASQISLVFITFLSYDLNIFALSTIYHGFFKALFFMVIGSVIFAMSNERNLFNLGGILKIIKISFFFAVIAGIFTITFPLILSQIEGIKEIKFIRITFLLNSCFTSYYVVKLIILTFFKNFKGNETIFAHAKEVPLTISFACLLTVIVSTVSFFALIKNIYFNHTTLYQLIAIILGSLIAFKRNYISNPTPMSEKIVDESRMNALYRLIFNLLIFKPAAFCADFIENKIIDSTTKNLTVFSLEFSKKVKQIKERNLFTYNLLIILSIVAVFIAFVIRGNS